MRRLLQALAAAALLAAPTLAHAHDPLDDVSGEDELNPQPDEAPKTSQRIERQRKEMAKELQERDDTEFAVTQEKEEFLRDRAETKDVLAAQRRRNQEHGGGARPMNVAPAPPKPEPASPGKH